MTETIPELAPELGPEAQVTARGLTRIGALAILIVCLGVVLAVDAIVRGFFGTVSGSVGWIPWLNQVVARPVHYIEHKIVSFLAGLEHDIDGAIAHNIHVLARVLDKLWHSLELLAANIILLGALAAAAVDHYVVQKLVRTVTKLIHKLRAEIRTIEHGVHTVTKVITKTVTHVIAPSVKRITVAVPRYIHRDLLRIRKEAMHAEKTATRALHKVENIPFPKSAKTWAEAVAIALPALGLDWLRCNSNPFKNNGNACGLWNDLKDLFGLMADLFLFATFCDLWAAATPFIGLLLDPVVALIATFADGACSHPPDSWAKFHVARGPLPPPQTLGPLAS